MNKLGMALMACLSLTAVAGCSDDDEKESGANGCYNAADQYCETYSDSDALVLCGALGGTQQACPSDNVEGSCVYEEGNITTTKRYYKGSDGSAWDDGFDDAAEDCDLYDGTYTEGG